MSIICLKIGKNKAILFLISMLNWYCNKGIYLLLLEGDMYSLISLKRYLRKLHISFFIGGDIMYNNPYMPNAYNPNLMQQSLNDKIDSEIAKLQQMKNQRSQGWRRSRKNGRSITRMP